MKNLSMAIVCRGGKVLLQKRFRRSQGMVFEFPGGMVNEHESGTSAAARELFEETAMSDLKHTATFCDVNQFGGRIYYALFDALEKDEPIAVDESRKQTFHWLFPEQIPLEDFYPADVSFIKNKLLIEKKYQSEYEFQDSGHFRCVELKESSALE
ncbi:NUDIX hydrolase [Vibrio caribbeanicus]|uniref:NUDIX hydrolase n=1 Tax=Vibrio caribbeanicus TaxID=701175 RepID=UPI0030D965C7